MKFYSSIALLTALLLFSCVKVEEFPPEPDIEYKSFEVIDGIGKLTFKFTDGDGDIGLSEGDTLDPYCFSCEYHFNLLCEYYELIDGEWTHFFLDREQGQVPFYYRVPRISPSGQNPSLIGEIDIDMNTYFLSTPNDTFRFEVQLIDRSLNRSNIVVSDTLIKPM